MNSFVNLFLVLENIPSEIAIIIPKHLPPMIYKSVSFKSKKQIIGGYVIAVVM